MLTKDRLDSAILEAASSIPQNKSVLDYLLPCWKRIGKALKGLRGYANAKDVILKEAKRLCMSNCIFAAEVPELFGLVVSGCLSFMHLLTRYRREPNSATDNLTPHLLLESGDERGLCVDFLNELHLRIDDDDSIRPMITKAVIEISSRLSKMTMNDEY
jgi:ubiquitin conjugation factor E4 B